MTRLWISTPDGVHNNYGIEFYSDRKDLVLKFYELGRRLFLSEEAKRFFFTFLQGDSPDFKYFEFWKSNLPEVQERILECAIFLEQEMGIPCDID